MKQIKGLLKSEKVGLLITMAICFLIHIAVLYQFDCWFSTDTDGYWLHAATFTGHDWSGVARNMNMYYSWGYSVLLVIPFLLADRIGRMYRIAILINVILCTLIVPIAYSLAKKIASDIDKKMLMLFSLIVSCYTSYILLSGVTLAETLIYFLYFLSSWAFYNFLDTDRYLYGVITGLAVGYLYITHHRNIGIVAALVIAMLMYLYKERNIKKFLSVIIPLLMMILFAHGVDKWLAAREMIGAGYKVNTYGTMVEKAVYHFDIYAFISIMQEVLGEIWYTLVGTFLTAGIGLVYLYKEIKRGNIKSLFSLFLILAWVMSIGASVMFLFQGKPVYEGRIDILFYGRYMEATVGVLSLLGLIAMYKYREDINYARTTLLLIAATIVLSIFIAFISSSYVDTGNNWFSIVAVLFPFFVQTCQIRVAYSSVFFISVILLIYIGNYMKTLIEKRIVYLVIIVLYVFIGYNATYIVDYIYENNPTIENNPTYNSDFNGICEYVNQNNIDEIVVPAGHGGAAAFSYQMLMPNVHVISANEVELIENTASGKCVVIKKELLSETYAENVIASTDNYYICQL